MSNRGGHECHKAIAILYDDALSVLLAGRST
jgi:hypothetical protein